MKRKLSQILCLFMAIQVFFASTGLAVVEHLCKVKGKQTFLISKAKKCCAERKTDTKPSKYQQLKKSKCCEEHSFVYKINTESAGSGSPVLMATNAVWLSESAYNFSFNNHKNQAIPTRFYAYYNAPPPIAGRNLLIQIQTYLI